MSEPEEADAQVDAVWSELTELSRQIGQDVTRISHEIGRVMEDMGVAVRRGSTAGARLIAYERAGYPGIAETRDGQSFCGALHQLVALRNRLEHDEWSVTYPNHRNPVLQINAVGEQHHVKTTIETIRLIAGCAEACAEYLQQMSSRTAVTFLFDPQASPPQLADVARQVVSEVERMKRPSEDIWHWEQLTDAEYYGHA